MRLIIDIPTASEQQFKDKQTVSRLLNRWPTSAETATFNELLQSGAVSAWFEKHLKDLNGN